MTYEEAQNILKSINKGINPHFSYCELIPKSIKKKNKKVKKSTPSKLKKVFKFNGIFTILTILYHIMRSWLK